MLPFGLSIFAATFITIVFLGLVVWMAYEIFTAPFIEFNEEESINELKNSHE